MPGTIGLDHGAAAAGLASWRRATEEFDAVVARGNPDASDAGAAAVLLERMLTDVAHVALRLQFELDTLADAAEAGFADLAGLESFAQRQIRGLEAGLP